MIGSSIAEIFEQSTGSHGDIGHGYTNSGHPVGAAAGLATIRQFAKTNVAENSAERGLELAAGLVKLKDKYEHIGDIRGIGLMHAVELVTDRKSKSPLDKSRMSTVGDAIYEHGVMIRISGNNIILSPPLIVTTDHIQTILNSLDVGLGSLVV